MGLCVIVFMIMITKVDFLSQRDGGNGIVRTETIAFIVTKLSMYQRTLRLHTYSLPPSGHLPLGQSLLAAAQVSRSSFPIYTPGTSHSPTTNINQ